jgi:hypothetical protein
MRTIFKGENVIFQRNLKKADGSPLLYADVSTLTVALIQNGEVIETLTKGVGAYIRQGDTTSQLEYEISTTTSNKFSRGRVMAKYTLIYTNAEFSGEGTQKASPEEWILVVK